MTGATTAEMIGPVGSTIEPILGEEEEFYLNLNVGYANSARGIQALSGGAVKLDLVRYGKLRKDTVSK